MVVVLPCCKEPQGFFGGSPFQSRLDGVDGKCDLARDVNVFRRTCAVAVAKEREKKGRGGGVDQAAPRCLLCRVGMPWGRRRASAWCRLVVEVAGNHGIVMSWGREMQQTKKYGTPVGRGGEARSQLCLEILDSPIKLEWRSVGFDDVPPAGAMDLWWPASGQCVRCPSASLVRTES